MKVTTNETLYMKNMVLLSSTSVEKDSSNCPFYLFSHYFWRGFLPFFIIRPSLFFWAIFFLLAFVSFFCFLTRDNALIMMIITLFITTQNYNSILRTKYDSIWMPPAVYRDMQWIKSDMYERIMNGGFATNTISTTWSCKAIWQWWTCHDERNGGKLHGNISRNAMEMP